MPNRVKDNWQIIPSALKVMLFLVFCHILTCCSDLPFMGVNQLEQKWLRVSGGRELFQSVEKNKYVELGITFLLSNMNKKLCFLSFLSWICR